MNKYRIINHATKGSIIVEANSPQEAAQKVGCRIKEVTRVDIGQPKLTGMTIDKAIELLQDTTTADERDFPVALEDAMKLGLEALKWVSQYRGCLDFHEFDILPGETKD